MTRSPKPESLYHKLTSKVASIFKRRQKETEPDPKKGFRPQTSTPQKRYHGKNTAHQNKMRAKRRTKAKGVRMSRRANRH